MKKSFPKMILCLLSVCVMLAAVFAGCSGKVDAPAAQAPAANAPAVDAPAGNAKTRIAFVSYQAFDSSEWLQNLMSGLTAYETENQDVEIKCIEALAVDQYEPKVRACCEQGYDIIITTYSDMADATIAVAKDYPDIKFGILQGEIENIADYANISDFHLNRTETAFVQGCAAALMTKTGKVGFVGGADSGGINEILAGYQQGIAYINNGTVDVVTYCNSFTDPTIGKEYALQLIVDGCDVIFGAAGGSGTGCAQAAEEQGVMYAACDVHYPDAAPTAEIGSALNSFENMVIAFIDDTLNGNYQGGTSNEYGIAQGAAGYEFASNGLVPTDIQDKVMEISDKVAAGEFKIDTQPLHK
ncbi:MAG: BMP family ABC transporter substrate-binding protein [Candidatus Pelethousia sp.]|nr:BMP family ABC transporter substrate-binding protein [Candidatus Pelethousia sp.]